MVLSSIQCICPLSMQYPTYQDIYMSALASVTQGHVCVISQSVLFTLVPRTINLLPTPQDLLVLIICNQQQPDNCINSTLIECSLVKCHKRVFPIPYGCSLYEYTVSGQSEIVRGPADYHILSLHQIKLQKINHVSFNCPISPISFQQKIYPSENNNYMLCKGNSQMNIMMQI